MATGGKSRSKDGAGVGRENPLLAPQVYDAALKGLNADTSTPKWIPAQESIFSASQGADALEQLIGHHSKY